MKFYLRYFFLIFISIYCVFAEETPDTSTAADSSVTIQSNPADTTLIVQDSTTDSTRTIFPSPDSSLKVQDSSSMRDQTSSVIADSSRKTDTTAIDTSYRVWKFPHIGFGAGWAPGAFPLFELWLNGRADETVVNAYLTNMPGIDSILEVSIIEKPASYNVLFPISFSFTPYVSEKWSLSFNTSFYWIRKHFLASYKLDTLSSYDIEEKLSIKNFSLGLKCNFKIPNTLFSISNIEDSYISFGFDGSPLVILREWQKITGTKEKTKNSEGIGIGWQAGFTTHKKLGEKNGLEVGFNYHGSWNGRFMDNDHHILRADINIFDSEASEVLTYVTHRFVLCFAVLAGKKEYR